ncbi:hypothetical protein BLNAU_6677 [Blattamonas nauphoetae]|uniref:Uncharacterized protein n=1 Tax=Blattamonas nauphoetae TaxID=2049346 RepID=A0ABQ9Y3U2_9EUKA|nr:hypothetical protein BLNAU_6677 [Blattamonas nauphoetae]
MEGNTTTISHTYRERQAVMIELENDHSHHLNHIAKGHTDASHSLFLFDNSTVSMKKLIFDCGCDGTAVAKVRSSEVVVSSSQIISNSKQTAFMVGTVLEGFWTSISVIDCSHISSASMVLLPLVSTSTCPPTPSRDSQSPKTLSPDTIPPFLSVSGVCLKISNVELILGTGPLLDFGKLTKSLERSEEIDERGISTVLLGNVLRNVTSPGCSTEQLVLPRGLSQKLVGTGVTRCTSHLSGTGCLDINAFGSVSCVNMSFSHCSSNDEPISFAHKHYKQDGRYEYTKYTTQISLTFHLCTFTSMTSTIDAACIHVYADFDVTISECSFKDNQGDFGGALSICGNANQGSMTISLCSFLNCVSRCAGAALNNQLASFLSINKCFFKNMTTTDSSSEGGCVCASKVNTATISECVFMDCSAYKERGFGGAICCTTTSLRLTSVQFRANSAPNGNDLYLASGCGSPSELRERVSDYHTDTFNTSLMMKGYETPTGIIKEFGTATIVTNLQLTLCPTASEGTIEVETAGEVKGTMLLLLDNTKPEESNSEDSPPAMCRVVVVHFPTPSKTGTSDVLPFGDDQRLQFPSTYSLLAASISATPIDVDSSSAFFTIDPKRVGKILYQPGTNIGEMLVWLEGDKLEVGEYTIHFEGTPSLSLNISFSTDQAASDNRVSSSVSVGPGGTDTRFAFGETYKVEKITFNNQPVLVENVGFSLVLPPFKAPFVIEVNEKKGGDDGSCRGDDNSCGSLDAAFETATKIGMKPTTLKLVNSETLSKTLTISDKNEVLMTKGGLVHPSLIVPATFSSSPLVVISVSNASLSLTAVDALIHSSSLDLKLVVVTAGLFKFSEGTITTKQLSTSNMKIRTSNNDLCSWTTGTIEIVNSTAVFKSCSLKNLAPGAIMQSGGKVTLEEVNFLSNGPSNKEFPSARRNVMCSSDGTLIVGGLTGDGRSRDFPGSGISAETCGVSGTATTMSIPFLNASQSKITHDKETRNFELELVGSGFLPCGLQVEVFASLKDGTEEVSDTLIVDTNTASTFTETRIEFIVTPKDVANLSKKAEWKVRLLNRDSSIGTEHLVLRAKPRSMIWLIPVIVVVVVVIAGVLVTLLLIWRCRHQKRVEKKDEMMKTANEATPAVTEPASDRPETESAVDPAINVSDMPTELTEENTKESSESPDRKISE